MNVAASLEQLFFSHRSECQFDTTEQSHLVILPGMLAPVSYAFPLVNFLRTHQSHYAVTAIPLGLSIASFESLIDMAASKIQNELLTKTDVTELIIFGHSFGGRVACELIKKLQHISPQLTISIITAGTPFVDKPEQISWFKKLAYTLFSRAFRQWPAIEQPQAGRESLKNYISYYSTEDKTVEPESATFHHQGNLRQLNHFSHTDFISGEKMGPILITLLEKEFSV